MVVTQFAMKPVESVGMLKIDFLGLKTLTSIQVCVNAIAAKQGKRIDWVNLPLDDQATFHILNQGRTLGIFQLESGGMQDLARQLHIDCFEEIIAVGALYRPGPMDMIPSFVNRKHGREAIEFDHPLMKEILAETYGVMVYQEQVMQIASKLAGYTLGEGDVLRRAMGKKDKEEMARQRAKFLEGCLKNGIDNHAAGAIFDKIEKFASYGFNKSHAAAYAYLTYVTAYLKANHPKEWMAALMTCDKDDISKVAKFIREAKAMHIPLLPPDINQAEKEFVAVHEGIRFAMSGIKGVGEGVVDAILAERRARGPFESLYHFVERIDKSVVGKKAIETLIEAGAFDFTKWSRDEMRDALGGMYEEASRGQKEESLGVLNLFSLIEKEEKPFSSPPKVLHKTSEMEILQREKELLGFYLTGHPMDAFKGILERLSCVPFKDFEQLPEQALVRAAFVIETVQVKISAKSQKKFAILTISDGIERFEMPVWADLYESAAPLLKENQLLYGIVQVERKEGAISLQARHLDALIQVDEAKLQQCDELYDKLKGQMRGGEGRRRAPAKEKDKSEEASSPLLQISIDANKWRHSHIVALKKLFRSYPGKSPVKIQFVAGHAPIGTLQIDSQWGVKIDGQFNEELDRIVRSVDV
jgi:DNA polymerase-3 subunit alpha